MIGRMVTFYGEDGNLALLNPDHIALVCPSRGHGPLSTVILMSGGTVVTVQGSMVQVAERLGIDPDGEGAPPTSGVQSGDDA